MTLESSFDFLMRTDKATSVLEGKYNNDKIVKNNFTNKATDRTYTKSEFENLYANKE